MTWIKTVPYAEASPELRRTYEAIRSLYPSEYEGESPASLMRPDGTSDSIVAAHSIIPEAMKYMMSGFAVLLRPSLPLMRRQHEMIASVVSVHNQCFH